MLFNSDGDVWFDGCIPEKFTEQEIKSCPQFFRFDYERAIQNKAISGLLSHVKLSGGFRYVVVDSRVHMLMPGWYPCIPGWHCDDFYRPKVQPEGAVVCVCSGQPDLENMPPSRLHSFIIGDTSFTDFVIEPLALPTPAELSPLPEKPLYGMYNDIIEQLKPKTRRLRRGEIIHFTNRDLHKGNVAEKNGWRFWVRITESDYYEPFNELRTQTQVYLPDPFRGW